MKLIATPLSHFARKSRILLDLYGAPYEFVKIDGLTSHDRQEYAGNPMMKVPILMDGSTWLVESDHISAYIVKKFDPSDKYQVNIEDVFDLNARAIMNAGMTEEVKVILARRTSVPTEQYPFFDKALQVIRECFQWLEDHADHFTPNDVKYREIHLLCFWQHVKYWEVIPMNFPKLEKIANEILKNPVIAKTAPQILKPR